MVDGGSDGGAGRRAAALLTAAFALVPACASGGVPAGMAQSSAAPAPSVAASSTSPSATGSPVRLLVRGSDVWAWHERLQGRCDCGGGCRAVRIEVNGTVVNAPVDLHGDRFTARVPLGTGANEVAAMCDRWGGGRAISEPITIRERLDPRPTALIHVAVQGSSVLLDGTGSRPSQEDGAPIEHYAWMARPGNPSALRLAGGGGLVGHVAGASLALAAPSADGEYYVSLTVIDAEGRRDTNTTYFVVSRGRPRVVDMATENPAWVDHAVVYGVIPFFFGNNGFRSVGRRLDYLKRVGINTIWLSPINASPPGDFGYAVTDYFSLNPNYGTKAQFRRLVQAAHARGIRVLMDFVPNHTSNRHPYFQDAKRYGPRSHYYDFYDRRPDGTPTHYFDWHNLPNLNYDNPEVRRMIMSAFEYYVRKFDVDGFRVDAAWGVRRRDPSFWPKWRRQLKRIKPDLLLLAEASARQGWYFSHGFDAAYDWTQNLGQWAWAGVFDSPTTIPQFLDSALTDLGAGYPKGALVFRFLNNNDTGPRFISRYGTDTTRVAAALLLTLPGIPLIYTGDEVGAMYVPYSDTEPISFRDEFHLRGWYRRLIALRERLPSLASRRFAPVAVEPATSVYAYLRWGGPPDPPALVLLNWAADTLRAHVSAGADLRGLGGRGALRDVLTGRRFRVKGSRLPPIKIPAMSVRILVPARAGQ